MRGRLYRRAPTQAKPKAWYQRDGGGRLAQDRERIAAAFPGLSYQIDEQAGRVFLEGTITLVAECGISTPIQVRVEFPDDYPEHEPRVYDAAQRFPYEADRHFYPDGRCCLWLPPGEAMGYALIARRHALAPILKCAARPSQTSSLFFASQPEKASPACDHSSSVLQ